MHPAYMSMNFENFDNFETKQISNLSFRIEDENLFLITTLVIHKYTA